MDSKIQSIVAFPIPGVSQCLSYTLLLQTEFGISHPTATGCGTQRSPFLCLNLCCVCEKRRLVGH